MSSEVELKVIIDYICRIYNYPDSTYYTRFCCPCLPRSYTPESQAEYLA